MAVKPLLPNVEPDDYAKRVQGFMKKLTDAYLSVENAGELRWNPLRTKFNEILKESGALNGALHTQSLKMFYVGKVNSQLYPYTLLRLAVVAQHYQNHFPAADRGTWGSTFEEGLNRICDELVYGRPAPAGAPADRWHQYGFSAAKVAAEQGLKIPEASGDVIGFTQLLNQLARLTLDELEEVGQTVLSILHARADVVVEAEDVEEDPLPCDQFCQIAVMMSIHRRVELPLPEEEIAAIAGEAKLPLERVQRILCGDPLSVDEADLLSGPARMPAESLKNYLAGINLLINNNSGSPA